MLPKLKLETDLVPRTSWFNNVRAVVSKKQWDLIRSQIANKAWNLCEICGDVGPKHPVECHEIWDYNDKTFIQKLVGMIALCPNCHMVKHIGFAQIQNRGEKALKHFMKVNNLKRKEAEQYIAEAFKIWNKRSQINWKLDISYLLEYGIDINKLKK